MLIGITLWLIIGALASLLVSRFIPLHGDDPRLSMGASGAAGLLAGFIHRWVSGTPITAWNLNASLWAAVGGLVAAGLWFAIRAKTATRAAYSERRSY